MPLILKPRCWRTCISVWTSWSCPMWTTPWGCWSCCPGPWATPRRLPSRCQGPPLPGGQENSYQLRPWTTLDQPRAAWLGLEPKQGLLRCWHGLAAGVSLHLLPPLFVKLHMQASPVSPLCEWQPSEPGTWRRIEWSICPICEVCLLSEKHFVAMINTFQFQI